MDLAIEIKDVDFAYLPGKLVLQGINLEVAPGQLLGLIGPNGGGKTTLLKLLLGLLKPRTGTITLLGSQPRQAVTKVGHVPQFSTFDHDFPISVFEVVLTGRLGANGNLFSYSRTDKQKAQLALEQLEIAHLKKNVMTNLSGGQLQRVLLARALVCDPEVLLLDEPTANMDIHGEESVFELLQNISHQAAILVVSHDLGFISKHVKKVACLNRQLICHDTHELTPQVIENIYGFEVRAIDHV